MKKLKAKVKALKEQLIHAETELLDARVEMLRDTHFVREMETLFYGSKERGYQYSTHGEVEEWARVKELSNVEDDMYDAFREVASELGFNVDFDNDCLLLPLGPDEIIINEVGDVFQGNKLILKRTNYVDTQDRNAQIEAHMERSGYFPGVFHSDRYGNLTSVDTKG